jgi:hypothetical protein
MPLRTWERFWGLAGEYGIELGRAGLRAEIGSHSL